MNNVNSVNPLVACPYAGRDTHRADMPRRVINGSSPGINLFQVTCGCGARGSLEPTEEEAIAAWNSIER